LARLPYYTVNKTSSGLRLIWFPVDQSKFEFRPHVYGATDNPAFIEDENDVANND
jgi:hypothetical protein